MILMNPTWTLKILEVLVMIVPGFNHLDLIIVQPANFAIVPLDGFITHLDWFSHSSPWFWKLSVFPFFSLYSSFKWLDKAEILSVNFVVQIMLFQNFTSNFLLNKTAFQVILMALKVYLLPMMSRNSENGGLMMQRLFLDLGISYYKYLSSFEGITTAMEMLNYLEKVYQQSNVAQKFQ